MQQNSNLIVPPLSSISVIFKYTKEYQALSREYKYNTLIRRHTPLQNSQEHREDIVKYLNSVKNYGFGANPLKDNPYKRSRILAGRFLEQNCIIDLQRNKPNESIANLFKWKFWTEMLLNTFVIASVMGGFLLTFKSISIGLGKYIIVMPTLLYSCYLPKIVAEKTLYKHSLFWCFLIKETCNDNEVREKLMSFLSENRINIEISGKI